MEVFLNTTRERSDVPSVELADCGAGDDFGDGNTVLDTVDDEVGRMETVDACVEELVSITEI